jgi:hypothetical protein
MTFAKINKWIGLDNIDKKYNTKSENKYGQMVADNWQLDDAIKELKQDLEDFYETNISPKLFDYQLLK